ncbi:MAG: hypothetical protein M1392_03605 [Gammaproteobacteria bacterium]|nr:hypothetical protein [Gammaproteobacteria bacterium]
MNSKYLTAALPLFAFACNAGAADSYRYLHVTLDTVWYIFLFLLPGVLLPLAVAAWLYWRHAKRGKAPGQDAKGDKP